MKKIGIAIILFLVLLLSACSKKIDLNYDNEYEFENELNLGKNLVGTTLSFTVEELKPNSIWGYDIWSGKHLNFVSNKNPNVKIGENIFVKITDIQSYNGSWVIKYQRLDPKNINLNSENSIAKTKIDNEYMNEFIENSNEFKFENLVFRLTNEWEFNSMPNFGIGGCQNPSGIFFFIKYEQDGITDYMIKNFAYDKNKRDLAQELLNIREVDEVIENVDILTIPSDGRCVLKINTSDSNDNSNMNTHYCFFTSNGIIFFSTCTTEKVNLKVFDYILYSIKVNDTYNQDNGDINAGWIINEYVDEFRTQNGEKYMTNYPKISGQFNNSASTNENVYVSILVDKNNISIRLNLHSSDGFVEKNVYSHNVEYTIKLKFANGNVENYKGIMYSKDDRIYLDDNAKLKLTEKLNQNENVMIYIENNENVIENYTFTVQPYNFSTKYSLLY